MSACEAAQGSQLQGYAMRFVEYCISQLQSTDTTLHNLAVCICFLQAYQREKALCLTCDPGLESIHLPISRVMKLGCCVQVSLYSQDADEQRLLLYLRTARGSLGSPLYDPQFALQVARQHGKLNACVQLLCEVNLHEVGARSSGPILLTF